MNNKQNYRWKEMTLGTCYYPEHWDEALWKKDLDRMKETGISVIRVAEFAWSIFEPEENVFEFDFFDKFLDLCYEQGMKVIFSTPTATPPAWLTEKYPEVLNSFKDGVLIRHGGRKQYNYNSLIYNELCKRIVNKLGAHYGKHPAIVGWQIDNELNCETCEFYSEADSLAFRMFLKDKYKTLEALNRAWGTVVWSQTYTSWEQIYVPRPTLNKGINPHMHLDYFRFVSESAIRFCKMQTDILRPYIKYGDYIMTNGMFWNLDNHRMEKECLDVYTYDSYPNFAFGLDREPKTAKDLNDRRWSKHLNEVRSICPHFGIMEQQSGANGWNTRMECPAPRPGQLSLWAMQSVAHGADFVSFFRWRTCNVGTEIYWHGILDYDNRENRKLREVKDFYKKLKSIDEVCAADYVTSFAIMKDYDNEWDTNVDVWHERIARHSDEEIFVAAEQANIPYDVIYMQEDSELSDLLKYPMIIYAHPVIVSEKQVALLEEYVRNGGILVLGCRSGLKDKNGRCVMLPQPGLLQRLTGTDVRDFTFTSPAEEESFACWDGNDISMPVFNDILTPLEGTKVLAPYGASYYKGEAAITENVIGKGKVVHFGAAFHRDSVKVLFEQMNIVSPFEKYIAVEDGVELVLRQKDNKKYIFVLNYNAYDTEVELRDTLRSLYDNTNKSGSILMKAYETAVYEII